VSESWVWCWGSNSRSQIGFDFDTEQIYEAPMRVDARGTGIVAVAAGAEYTCALAQDNKITCWGLNINYQLGGKTEHLVGEVTIEDISATAIAAGDAHACAITDAGGVMCWGINTNGQLGNGATGFYSLPQQVQGLTQNVIGITAGGGHTCAFTNVGAKCWGMNNFGQLGNNTTTDSNVPVDVLFY